MAGTSLRGIDEDERMDAEVHLDAAAEARRESGDWRPYAPSYIDRFMGWVERLPFPYSLTYVALFALHVLILLALSWIDGWLPIWQFSPAVLILPLWLWGPVAIITHLDSLAREALADFGTLLSLDDSTRRRLEQFDLFRLDPVYAFSVLTSRTGIAWVFLLTITLLSFPIGLGGVPLLVTMGIQVALAILAFALPLQVVHRRLAAEKRRLRAEHDGRLQATLARLHERVDTGDLAEISAVNDTIAGLNIERESSPISPPGRGAPACSRAS